jgi:DivIVA domain-containing protein
VGVRHAVEGSPMTTHTPPHAWRPEEVRRKQFTVRFRGLDPNEVRGFLNLVADDLERLQGQVASMRRDQMQQRDDLEQAQDQLAQTRAELEQARADLQRARVEPTDQVTDQAVLLLDQAQQLADALIEEGMQSARDLMIAARSHQREIVSPTGEGDYGPIGAATASGQPGGAGDGSVPSEVDEVRNFARVAQLQFRAVLEALNEQVNRLGNMSDDGGRVPPADHHTPAPARALNGTGNGYDGYRG